MSIDEFTTIVKTLKTVYADPKYIPNQDAVMVWYQLLKDLEYKQCMNAVSSIMQTSKFLPTVAEIREQCANHTTKPLDGMEAWGKYVIRAIRDSAYHSEERFAEMPEVVQRAVGSPQTLYEWAITKDENAMSNAQARFLRAYESASNRAHYERQISPALLNAIRATQVEEKPAQITTERHVEIEMHKTSMSEDTQKRIEDFLSKHCV